MGTCFRKRTEVPQNNIKTELGQEILKDNKEDGPREEDRKAYGEPDEPERENSKNDSKKEEPKEEEINYGEPLAQELTDEEVDRIKEELHQEWDLRRLYQPILPELYQIIRKYGKKGGEIWIQEVGLEN